MLSETFHCSIKLRTMNAFEKGENMINYDNLKKLNLAMLTSTGNSIVFTGVNGKTLKVSLGKEKKEKRKGVTIREGIKLLYGFYAIFQPFFKFTLNGVLLNGVPFMVGIGIILYQYIPIHETRKTHAAEHMLVTAFAKLGHIPDLEEIKKFGKRTSRLCGSNKAGHMLTTLLFLLIISYDTIFISKVLETEVVILLYLLVDYSGINITSPWQLLTVSKPTEAHLEMAIKGLESWVES